MVPIRRPHSVRPYFKPFRVRLTVERLEDRCVFAVGGTDPAPLLTQFGSAEEFREFYFDIDAAVEAYRHLFGTTTQYYWGGWRGWWGEGDVAILGIPQVMMVGAPAFAALSAEDAATQTNVQEQGVDEADLVKTDGEFIYLIRNGELVIVDARARRDLNIASQTDIEGSPLAQYLIGDRLTVISQEGGGGYYYGGRGIFGLMTSACWAPGGYDPKVKVTVFDVSNAYAPEIVEETYLDGSYTNSRAIGDNVYLVVQNYLDPLPAPAATYTQLEDSYSWTYETEAEYRQRVSSEGLPWYWSVDAAGTVQQSGPLSEAAAIYRPESPNERNLVSVVAFDVADDATGPADSVTLAASSATIYASTSHLYLVGQRYSYDTTSGYDVSSIIHKVSLDGSDVELAATGQVRGHVLNQFSMDEENGYFRIATSTDGWWSGGGSNVYILAEEGDALNVVGALENLAPGEKLYSASFFDDVGFLVTFVRIDPLFALDLSDPTNPRVMGELKIPGYSDYLQPIDDHHLLAIGRDTEVASWGGVLPDELQVSLFDVSDLTNPILLDRYSFEGGRSGSSIAGGLGGWGGNDHHAFTYDAGHGILAIPFTLWSGSHLVDTNGDGTLDTWVSDTNYQLRLFQVDQAEGIDVLGSIAHDSPVLRSFVIGDRLFSLAQDSIKVHALKNLERPLAELELPQAGLVVSSTGESFPDLPRDRIGVPLPPVEEEPPVPVVEETPVPVVEEVPVPVVEETPAPDVPPVIVEEPEPVPDEPPPVAVITESAGAADVEPSALALPIVFPSEGIELEISIDVAEPTSLPAEPSFEAAPASAENESAASPQLPAQLAEPDAEEVTDDLFASWQDDELEPLLLPL